MNPMLGSKKPDGEAELELVQRARVLQLVAQHDPGGRRALAGDPRVLAQVRVSRVEGQSEGTVSRVGDGGDLSGDQERDQDQSSPRSPNSFIFICRLLREILSSFAVLVTFPFVTSSPRTIRSRSIAWTCSLTISLRGPGVLGSPEALGAASSGMAGLFRKEGGRSAARITGRSAKRMVRSSTFSNSRMLPGQE